MSNDTITAILNDLTMIFDATDNVLNDWNGPGNLQIPLLVQMMAVKFNWDEKQMREADPLVRYYVRKHPDWHVTRGAKGGIMRVSDKLKKEAARLSKTSVKEQLKAQIDSKVASLAMDVDTTDATLRTLTTDTTDLTENSE